MNSFKSRGLLTGFAMVFATLLVTAALGYLNVRRLYEHDRLVEHAHQVLSELRLLLGTVADAESAMRGFVITSDPTYLKPYESAGVTSLDSLDRIERLTADNRRQQQTLVELRGQIERRMDLMRQAIEATRGQSPEAARAEVRRGEGQAAMEVVRDLIRKMESEESALLTTRVGEATVAYWTTGVTSLISAIIGLTLAALGLVLMSREVNAREQRARDLRELNERLEQRVRQRTAELSTANAALRDEIAERRQAEQSVRLVADKLERSNRELAQFAAVASHDLQEPLRKIQAFGDRLFGQCHDQLNNKGREYLERMLASAVRMRALIDGLLEYSRVATHKQPPTPVDLGRVARDVVGDLEARLQQSGGQVEVGELPTIVADPLQIRQLLQNLIGNALKFQPKDRPPHVSVSGRVVEAPTDGNTNLLRELVCELIVEDNGVGFEPAYAQRIFELFQRLHDRDAYEGTGMGLAICKKIAERHGGQIVATSTPGRGSRFIVTLPLAFQSSGQQP
jgi:signal transduction histidine kinase